MSDNIRNTGPMLASPRCGAKTRAGGACRSSAKLTERDYRDRIAVL
jgi:hypothetical protein